MIDETLEKIHDEIFKEMVEKYLGKFIKDVLDIKTKDEEKYRVLFSVRIVNMNTGNVIDIERS